MEMIICLFRKKARLAYLVPRVNPLDYWNWDFLTCTTVKSPIQEQQELLRKCLAAKVKEKGTSVFKDCNEYQAAD